MIAPVRLISMNILIYDFSKLTIKYDSQVAKVLLAEVVLHRKSWS